MKLSELNTRGLSESVAYILGLLFPLEKVVDIDNKKYLVGSVNHNSGMVTSDELTTHWSKILSLFERDGVKKEIQLVANKYRETTISSKKGFSVLVEIDCDDISERKEILINCVRRISNGSEVVRKAFVRGCFDGRSSYDTTYGFLPIDVDRDYSKQDLVERVMSSLNIEVNLNRREDGHDKNDQIRVKPESLNVFLNAVNMFSVGRLRLIENGLEKRKGKMLK